MTEINWSFIITRAGAFLTSGALTTIDLSAPPRILEQLVARYAPCTLQVMSSTGETYRKSCE